MNLGADEMHAGPVLDGDPGSKFPGGQKPVIGRPALHLAVIVRAAAARKKTQTIERTQPLRERIRQALFKPADRARAHAREHNARLPSLAENFHNTPIAQQGEQTLSVSAADIDHVLIEQERAQIRRTFEQREYRRPAAELQERRVETGKVMIRLAACRRHEGDAGILHAALPNDVFLQLEIFRVAIKPTAADGNDLPGFFRHGRFLRGRFTLWHLGRRAAAGLSRSAKWRSWLAIAG